MRSQRRQSWWCLTCPPRLELTCRALTPSPDGGGTNRQRHPVPRGRTAFVGARPIAQGRSRQQTRRHKPLCDRGRCDRQFSQRARAFRTCCDQIIARITVVFGDEPNVVRRVTPIGTIRYAAERPPSITSLIIFRRGSREKRRPRL